MVVFNEKSVLSLHPGGFHRIFYSEFLPPNGAPPSRTVVCVHGLSRNGRDFDWLAQDLAASGCRVICPDMAGRGRSPAFSNPAWYNYQQYLADMVALLAALNVDQVDWVGTSMGGIIGLLLAAQSNHPIRRMVINDIGLFIPATALSEIKAYVSENPSHATWDSFYSAFKKRMQPFGLQTEDEWQYLAKVSSETTVDGKYRLAYDPKVVFSMESDGHVTDFNLWPLWNQVKLPMLILRGANSNVLSAETLDQMCAGRTDVTSCTFEGVGHAPALMNQEQISIIKQFII